MLCKGVTKFRAAAGLRDGRTVHPCRWQAIRDGYCYQHHPEDRIRALLKKETRLEAQLGAVRGELAECRFALEEISNPPINPS